MGQLSSSAVDGVKSLKDEVISQAGQLNQLSNAALCSYDEFMIQIQELNNLANKVVSQRGHRLTIGVKRGSADRILLWRATVRIAVVQWDLNTNAVVSKRLLTLPQFLRVSTSIKQQLTAATETATCPQEGASNNQVVGITPPGTLRRELTLSILFDEMAEVCCSDSLNECCICLERKPDVMLPCAHAYCLPCIEQWNESHKTCPICREKVETTDDAWVLADGPGSDDVRDEIYFNLMQLSQEPI